MVEDQEGLPDDAFVLRAGIMDEKDMMNNALAHYDKTLAEEDREEWALSVNSLPGVGINEIARRANKNNRCLRVSRVDFLRALDLEVRPDGTPDGHSNIILNGPPTLAGMRLVRHVFARPSLNAGREKKEGESRRCQNLG